MKSFESEESQRTSLSTIEEEEEPSQDSFSFIEKKDLFDDQHFNAVSNMAKQYKESYTQLEQSKGQINESISRLQSILKTIV